MVRHGVRREAWRLILIAVGAALCVGGLSKTVAAEKETRIFQVKIDGTPAGSHHMEINSPDDHTLIVNARANVSVSRLLIKVYSYSYRGTEEWQAGRLVRLKSQTNDNGKQFEVLARTEGEHLRIRVNGEERMIRPDIWTMTYWRLPESPSPTQPLALLDCDTGKDFQGSLRYVSMQRITVAGQPQDCAYYQVRGEKGLQVDLWYDARKRLVRQDALDDGHHVVLELLRIER